MTATLLLAHGAGAPMDSPFMETMAAGLTGRGWRVQRFEFPYMAQRRLDGRRRLPDRLPKLLAAYRAEVTALQGQGPLVIGGKSLGGRVATLLVDELAQAGDVCGCLCLGYPFHPSGRPTQLRTEHLAGLTTPTLILQGERDSFGRRDEVEGYALAPAIQLQWIPAGDHSFRPPRASGHREVDNLSLAVELADRFCRELPAPAPLSPG